MAYRALPIILALVGCSSVEDVDERTQAAVAGSTVISLTFDDTFADNFQVGAIAEAHGMRATFFVNSGRIGQSGSLSLAQLIALRDAGHEIGGHTITHADLEAADTDEAKRQICNDRESFLANGFRVTSFAYPFSAENAKVRQLAAECGYNSARLVGGLVVPESCSGCPYANPMPPVDPMGVRANDSVDNTTTLDRMKLYVTQAEQHGGGWVPIVMHHVCDGCNELAITPAQLDAFLDWLQPRAAQGTVVATVDAVMGGSVKPAVTGPRIITNMLQNASLETDANNDQIPDCWKRDGYGTNTATFTLTSNAYSGARAQKLDVTSFTSGGRRLVSAQDSGACAPAAIPGHRYTITARYIANAQPIVSVYVRNSSGSWSWFAESARLPTASSYALATYTTPPLPTGTTHISVGVSLISAGSLTTDQYTLVDANDGSGPSVSLSQPAANSTQRGLVEIFANATDPSGVDRVEFLVNGSVVGTDSTYPYWIAWNSAAFARQTVSVAARAYDVANNPSTSSSRQITIQGTGGDMTPPIVDITSPANGAAVSGTVTLSASAVDAESGIARVEFFANGTLVATELNAPYELPWDTTPYAGQTVTLTARAYNGENIFATSNARTVTVTGGGSTVVAITNPPPGPTVAGTITVSADASDPDGIARVELYANSDLIGTDTTAPYAVSWNTTPYSLQTVSLTARMVDTLGNVTISAPRTVAVEDTMPPTVALTSPAAGATVSGIVTISADASDANGIARVDFIANGTVLATDITAPYTMQWDTAPYAGQSVTLTARAFDGEDNPATSAPRTVTVTGDPNNAPPVVVLTGPVNNANVVGTVPVTADASDADGIARVELYANGTLFGTDTTAPYSVSWNSDPFIGQDVTLTARAYDTLNNATTSSPNVVHVQGSTDTTPPTVALTSPADGATVIGTVTLAADAADANGVKEVEFFANNQFLGRDTTAPFTLAWDTTAFQGQTLSLRARAFDLAGNVAQSTTRTVTVAATSPANLLQNGSLEIDANADQVPDCWQRGGSGTNTAQYTLTGSNSYVGEVAQRIEVISLSSGARRIVTRQDTGACAPPAVPGRRYTVSARYYADAATVFTVYYRNSAGTWVWWAQSPTQPTSTSYTLGTYTTPPLPAGATHISVGLSIIAVGSVTMDDLRLVEAP